MDTYDLDIFQGATFSLSITLRDVSGNPLILTGQQISGFLKTHYSDSGHLTDLNATITDANNGVITLSIPATGTAALPVNYAFYDVEMLNTGNGFVTKVLAGKASVYPEATF